MRVLMMLMLMNGWVFGGTRTPEAPSSANRSSASCTFKDGKQLVVQYLVSASGQKPENIPDGKIWEPGGSAMTLFTQTELTIDNAQIPVGAYSVYVIPAEEDWTLIVNKNVVTSKNYDEKQDIVRARMQTGTVSEPAAQFAVYLSHVAPQQCNIRLYYGKTGAWAEFKEK